jgi:hypothetical protein
LKELVTLFKDEFVSIFELKLLEINGFKENLILLANKLLKLCNRFNVQK